MGLENTSSETPNMSLYEFGFPPHALICHDLGRAEELDPVYGAPSAAAYAAAVIHHISILDQGTFKLILYPNLTAKFEYFYLENPR